MAPVEPGIPERHSIPASPSATRAATNSSHGSPACTVNDVPSRSTPRVRTCTTVPGKPSSATTRLLPPASTSTGSPAASASLTAATSSSSVLRLDEAAGRAAQAERRQVGELLHPHGIIAVVTDAEILAVAAVVAGGACHSATGFGFVLVAGPLVVAALPPEEAITTLLLLGILMSSLTLLTEMRRPEPLWPEAGWILAWGVPGALAGAALLARLDETALQLLVTVDRPRDAADAQAPTGV